jgi:type I restriction enzyme M protein
MEADGYSLDDKREPKDENDIPDILEKYQQYKNAEGDFTDKKQKAFVVDKADIAENKYDLSINRYKEVVYEEVEYDPPEVILDQLEALEAEIQSDLKALRGML